MVESTGQEVLRIAVLYGGKSAEREISLASGICVAAALEEIGHQVRGIDTKEVDLIEVDWRAFDVCFVALHGGDGEGGQVQSLLQSLHVPYTGSGPEASRLALSKSATKQRLNERGIPTARFQLLHLSESIREMLERARALGFPLVVKPDAQGSSLGVNLARTENDFQRAVAESQFYDSYVVAEEYLPGREFTVAVLGREALPPLEIVSNRGLFDYEAKYNDHGTECDFHTNLAAPVVRNLKRLAVETAKALRSSGLVRVDLRMDVQGNLQVLELNTIPGMTEASLAPRAAAEAGIDMPTLCDQIVRKCLVAEVSS